MGLKRWASSLPWTAPWIKTRLTYPVLGKDDQHIPPSPMQGHSDQEHLPLGASWLQEEGRGRGRTARTLFLPLSSPIR